MQQLTILKPLSSKKNYSFLSCNRKIQLNATALLDENNSSVSKLFIATCSSDCNYACKTTKTTKC
ncbi:hypothetical protein [uncultured Methanobrevibacter sp.]|uniref:hypothetical protein n=1 Tax=uncultured Methanobrevibacter sp. TaxID=253161 RepID=UPI0025EF71D2|nr:hypothetical protein [uncultured Methanobrevibacter sp.]